MRWLERAAASPYNWLMTSVVMWFAIGLLAWSLYLVFTGR